MTVQAMLTGACEESFATVCDRVLATAGGRLDRQDLARRVRAEISDDQYVSLTWSAFVGKVVGSCRAKDAHGLPKAQSFDGEVVQRELWEVDDYCRSIVARRSAITAEWSIIKALRAECEARHGVRVSSAGEVAA